MLRHIFKHISPILNPPKWNKLSDNMARLLTHFFIINVKMDFIVPVMHSGGKKVLLTPLAGSFLSIEKKMVASTATLDILDRN